MINSKEKIVNILIEKGNELFKQEYKYIEFTKNKEADKGKKGVRSQHLT